MAVVTIDGVKLDTNQIETYLAEYPKSSPIYKAAAKYKKAKQEEAEIATKAIQTKIPKPVVPSSKPTERVTTTSKAEEAKKIEAAKVAKIETDANAKAKAIGAALPYPDAPPPPPPAAGRISPAAVEGPRTTAPAKTTDIPSTKVSAAAVEGSTPLVQVTDTTPTRDVSSTTVPSRIVSTGQTSFTDAINAPKNQEISASAEEARKAAINAVTAKRRELEARGLTAQQIQSNPELIALQNKLEKAKSGVGLLTTQESLAALNRIEELRVIADQRGSTTAAERAERERLQAALRGPVPFTDEDTGSGQGGAGGGGGGGGRGGGGANGDVIPIPVVPTTLAPVTSALRGARDFARLLAQQFGLGDDFFNAIDQLITEDLSEASITLALRQTDAYKKRFAANATRVSKGLPALSEAEYLNMEKLYRDTLREAGLPSQLFDNQDDFTTYLANDISYNEFTGRVSLAQRASQTADPAIKAQLKERYNIDESGLVAYFLNPEKTKPFLQRQYNVAQTAAALQQAGFGTAQAEELTGSVLGGATDTTLDYKELTQAAQSAGVLRPLSQQVLGGEGGAVTEQELLRGVVAGDVSAQAQLEREQRRRLAEYQTGGGFAEGQQGVTGLRRAAR
jgi:hypothetical protein